MQIKQATQLKKKNLNGDKPLLPSRRGFQIYPTKFQSSRPTASGAVTVRGTTERGNDFTATGLVPARCLHTGRPEGDFSHPVRDRRGGPRTGAHPPVREPRARPARVLSQVATLPKAARGRRSPRGGAGARTAVTSEPPSRPGPQVPRLPAAPVRSRGPTAAPRPEGRKRQSRAASAMT